MTILESLINKTEPYKNRVWVCTFTLREFKWAVKHGWKFSEYGKYLIQEINAPYPMTYFPTDIAFIPDNDTELILKLTL